MRFPLLLMFLIVAFAANAQRKADWWKVSAAGMTYKLPSSWAADPFSSSSVCDCWGVINDNGKWKDDQYMGIVIYPVTSMDSLNTENRQYVWGYKFNDANAQVDTVQIGGMPFLRTRGAFDEYRVDSEAWRIVSLEEGKGPYQYVLYFWSTPRLMRKHTALLESILETMKPWKKANG